MKTVLRFIFLFSFLNSFTVNASECYNYHTPHYYKLFVESNQLVFQHTVKDPNGISYVSQESIVISSISAKYFTIINEDNEVIVFKNVDGYFILEKSTNEVKEYGVSKIGSLDSVQEILGTHFFCLNGEWNYITANNYSNKIIKKQLKNVPLNLKVLAVSSRDYVLFKNQENVYVFSPEAFTFKVIPNLNPESTKFVKVLDPHKYIDVLFDKNTVSTLDQYFSITDNTPLLSKFNAFKNFKNATIVQYNDDIVIDTNDGYLWCYVANGKDIDNIGDVKFIPLKASFLNNYKQLINTNGKTYLNAYDAVFKKRSLDMSTVKNIENFRKEGFYYTDDIHNYEFKYNEKTFTPINTPNTNADYYPPINTYNFLGNQEIYVDKNNIYGLNRQQKFVAIETHKSKVKDLQLAIAYDDKLLIEFKEIKNIGNRKEMILLGSFVNVISPCDGGMGQYPVEIDVYYFFKDKEHIYVCNTNNLKMRIVKDIDLDVYQADNFKQLEVLMNLEKK